jgi:ABC-type uncharacterized transport system substrate-binding protein
MMRRREFIAGLAGAATWPIAAGAQQGLRVRRIGILASGSKSNPDMARRLSAFSQGLRELGWIDGRSVRIDARGADGDANRLRASSAELVGKTPDVIFASGNTALRALQQATQTIPIVFAQVPDPIAAGFVTSLARPSGNITGFANYEQTIAVKWLELLKECAPHVNHVALMYDPQNPAGVGYLRTMEATASLLSIQVSGADVHDAQDVADAFEALARESNSGLILLPSPAVTAHRDLIIAEATRRRLPTVSPFRDFVAAGALASYGVDNVDLHRRAASYVDRILKGEKPGDLPVQLATKYELVINLKTAKALRLDIPPSLLSRADEVIE